MIQFIHPYKLKARLAKQRQGKNLLPPPATLYRVEMILFQVQPSLQPVPPPPSAGRSGDLENLGGQEIYRIQEFRRSREFRRSGDLNNTGGQEI